MDPEMAEKMHCAVYWESVELGYKVGDLRYFKEAWRPLMFQETTMIGDLQGGHKGSVTLVQWKANANGRGIEDRAWKESPCGYRPKIRAHVEDGPGGEWETPFFMPAFAARLFYIIEEIKVLRLGDMTEKDYIDEGIQPDALTRAWSARKMIDPDDHSKGFVSIEWFGDYDGSDNPEYLDVRENAPFRWQSLCEKFQAHWNSINGKKHPYDPKLWVVQTRFHLTDAQGVRL